MKFNTKMLGVALVAVLGSGVVVAADGLYVGAGVMHNTASARMTNPAGATTDLKSGDQNNLNAFAGYHMSFRSLSLAGELGYADGYGKSGTVGGASATLKNSGPEYSILPGYKVSKDLEVFGRYGVTRVDVSLDGSSKSADSRVLGLGADYAVSKQYSVRAEYQKRTVSDIVDSSISGKAKASGYGVAVKYAF